jgi:hypothetical protein
VPCAGCRTEDLIVNRGVTGKLETGAGGRGGGYIRIVLSTCGTIKWKQCLCPVA